MNIVLIGYRCSGKSVVGKTLADRLGLKWVDTDKVLERRVGCGIAEYVSEKGWDAFRMVEKMIIRSVSNEDGQIIATGGGVVLDWENIRHLRQSGWVVFLQAGVSTIYERMIQDERSGTVRPGLVEKNPSAEIEMVLKQRMALYERSSDIVVNTDRKSPEKVSHEIIQSMPKGFKPLQDENPMGAMVSMSALNP
jgi:shikimate kinase